MQKAPAAEAVGKITKKRIQTVTFACFFSYGSLPATTLSISGPYF